MPQDFLVVRGAREHNLKDITVELPRDRIVYDVIDDRLVVQVVRIGQRGEVYRG